MMNKNIKLILACISFFPLWSTAQDIEFRPTVSYTFRETVPIVGGRAVVQASETYGISVGYIANKRSDLNFSYQVQPTYIDIERFPTFISDGGISTKINYYQLGFNRNFIKTNTAKIIPYAGAKIGVAYINMNDANFRNVTRLAIGFNGGVKIMLTDRLGINTFAMLQSPIEGLGLAVTVGNGGVSPGVAAYSTVLQFSLGGGLVVKLK